MTCKRPGDCRCPSWGKGPCTAERLRVGEIEPHGVEWLVEEYEKSETERDRYRSRDGSGTDSSGTPGI